MHFKSVGKRWIFQQIYVGQFADHLGKTIIKQGLYCGPYTKINSRWTEVLNVKTEIIKALIEKMDCLFS